MAFINLLDDDDPRRFQDQREIEGSKGKVYPMEEWRIEEVFSIGIDSVHGIPPTQSTAMLNVNQDFPFGYPPKWIFRVDKNNQDPDIITWVEKMEKEYVSDTHDVMIILYKLSETYSKPEALPLAVRLNIVKGRGYDHEGTFGILRAIFKVASMKKAEHIEV
jgi:hypothetical protein